MNEYVRVFNSTRTKQEGTLADCLKSVFCSTFVVCPNSDEVSHTRPVKGRNLAPEQKHAPRKRIGQAPPSDQIDGSLANVEMSVVTCGSRRKNCGKRRKNARDTLQTRET